MLVALTRPVSRSIAECKLTHLERTPIDLDRARAQHAEYERALDEAGCRVIRLPELPDHPDAVFVEDTVVVLDEVAVLTRPGALSRLGEVDSMAKALAPFRRTLRLDERATLDGGDVLRLGRTLYIGLSSRTNAAAVEQLQTLLTPLGYRVESVEVVGALHLKTTVTQVAPAWLLANPAWVDPELFPGFDTLTVHSSEPFAANAVYVNGVVIHSTAYPHTQEMLRAHGAQVRGVDASELAKAEGGVTCCSVVLDVVN